MLKKLFITLMMTACMHTNAFSETKSNKIPCDAELEKLRGVVHRLREDLDGAIYEGEVVAIENQKLEQEIKKLNREIKTIRGNR